MPGKQEIEGSSAIEAVEMRGDDLIVYFINGGKYLYEDVGRETMTAMINSDSAGAYFAREIRPHFQGQMVPEVADEEDA